jgi:hypothetical protein
MFLLHQFQPWCQDQHRNQHIRINVDVITNKKMECHVNFDNPTTMGN